jgi:hypothetical protein
MSNKKWEYQYSVEGKASKSAVWKLYSNVKTWPEWDKGIESITLDGEFMEGAPGMIKPKGQENAMPFRLTWVEREVGFSDETVIPGADVTVGFTHTLESTGDGSTRITHRVWIAGPAGDSLGTTMGPGITDGVPETMQSLMKMAEEEEAVGRGARLANGAVADESPCE